MEFYLMRYLDVLPFTLNSKFAVKEDKVHNLSILVTEMKLYLLDSEPQVNFQKLWLQIISVIVFFNLPQWVLGPIKSSHHRTALSVSGKEFILPFPQLKNNRMDQDGILTTFSLIITSNDL